MQKKIQILFSIVLLFAANYTLATNQLPENAPYPGGLIAIPLPLKNATPPTVYFGKQRVLIQKDKATWKAIVGISLYTKPGTHEIVIYPEFEKPYKKSFNVKTKKYPLRHITIKDKSKVTPNPTLTKKMRMQKNEMQTILTQWNYINRVPTKFILPVNGRFSSPFGVRRIYNNVKPGRHTGFDIAAASGTPIFAAAKGRIITIKNYELTGNTVFIDHGQGLITFYSHMRDVSVKPGEIVQQGKEIGTVGATGRVTGSHLHWGAVLNSAKINPLLFTKSNKKP